MTASAEWKGQPVLVTSKLIPRFLWQTASIDVYVNKQCVLQTGGQFKATGSHTSQFRDAGKAHEALLKWGHATLRSFPIEFLIDGERVLEARVYTSNWLIGLVPWVGLGLAVIYWVQWASK